jgi:putative ABC transport system permease protein
MFPYYLRLGVRHLRRNPILTALIVVTLGVGVAASMSTLTILHVMSSDPIPEKSDRLFTPLVDIRPAGDDGADVEPPPMLSYRDAVALHAAGRGVRQTAVYGVAPAIDSGRPDVPPFFADGVAVHHDFFTMFRVPFVRGGAWSAADDANAARVVVLRERVAERLFDGADPIGKTVKLGVHDHIVAGVVADDWQPLPKFYRLVGSSSFGEFEEVFVPFSAAIATEMSANGQLSCYDDKGSGVGFSGLIASDCVWIMFWVELASAAEAPAYKGFLDGYVAEQKKLGRLPHPINNRLYDVMGWLEARQVVANDARLQTYVAFGFLLVCLVNTLGLLLARFTARAGEIGVRRALGAARRAVFAQYMVETAVVGLAGGVVGLGLTKLALWAIGSQSPEITLLVRMDGAMLATTFAVAVGASLLAGLWPTWRASQVRPALQLKSQ